MKKTLTINLGGTVYHIDEDAYHLLDNYLANLRIHFRREEGAEEIVHDMELRISELFADRLNEGKQVITIEDVEEIIARMGKPEELSGEGNGETSGSEKTKGTTIRRLFRDPDNKVLGGVASGLAAYMGWDVTWVRIILLVLGFFVHGVILAYIIAWIIIPMAYTAPEKLAMKGAAINVDCRYVRCRYSGYRYSYYRTDTHADASFWRLATHVHCNQNYIYRIVAHRFGSGCFLCTE